MFILDPGFEFFHPGSASNLSTYFNSKKWFLSARKYDPGCSSRIRDPDILHIPDPGVKKAPDPESGSATLFSCCVFYLVSPENVRESVNAVDAVQGVGVSRQLIPLTV
jgi:hypothetical protein